MINVGDNHTFIMNGTHPSLPVYYVWQFWDNSVQVTSSGTASKVINMGGNPSDGFKVRYTCTLVDDIAQYAIYSGALTANNPPVVLQGSPVLARNGDVFPFNTNASLIAYDLEADPLHFAWYAGGQLIGTGTNSFQYGHINGTYAGTIVGGVNVSSSAIDYMVTQNGSLSCAICDASGGTTVVDFPIFGRSPQMISLSSGASGGAHVDASSTPDFRIGLNQTAEFTIYTPAQLHQLQFRWAYFGSYGWNETEYSYGVTTAFLDGSFQSRDVKGIQNETPGQKTVEVFVTDQTTGETSTIKIGAFLRADSPPSVGGVTILPPAPKVGDFVSFAATASDPDNDLVRYDWTILVPGTNSGGQGTNSSLSLYGRTVYFDTSGQSSGATLHATVAVTDVLGATTLLASVAPALT